MQLGEWSSGIGKYIVKIEEGKSVLGNFRGEVVRFYQHWAGGRPSICPGRETCPLCNGTDEDSKKATGRFRVNFLIKGDDGNPSAMIFEAGRRVYDQMIQINKDIPLEKAWVRIARTGSKQNTQYLLSVLPGDAGVVKPAQEKQLLSVKLHDLSLSKPEEDELDANEETPFENARGVRIKIPEEDELDANEETPFENARGVRIKITRDDAEADSDGDGY